MRYLAIFATSAFAPALLLSACGGETAQGEGGGEAVEQGAEVGSDAATGSSGDSPADADAAAAAPSLAGMPQVAEPYRRSFARAWERAGEGRAPTNACAVLFGSAVGRIESGQAEGGARDDAIAAMGACYVDAHARYIRATLAESGCQNLMRDVTVMRSSIGSFFDDVGEDRADYDARLAEEVGGDIDAVCPELTPVILRTG